VEELVEYVHPSRRGLLQRGLVCNQGEFSIVSVTASVQVLFDEALCVKRQKVWGNPSSKERTAVPEGVIPSEGKH
jgi:hypothetical protein